MFFSRSLEHAGRRPACIPPIPHDEGPAQGLRLVPSDREWHVCSPLADHRWLNTLALVPPSASRAPANPAGRPGPHPEQSRSAAARVTGGADGMMPPSMCADSGVGDRSSASEHVSRGLSRRLSPFPLHPNFKLQFILMDVLEKFEKFRVDLGKAYFLYVFLNHKGACAGYSPQEPTASGNEIVDRLLSPSHVCRWSC